MARDTILPTASEQMEQLNVRALQANLPPPPTSQLRRPVKERAIEAAQGVWHKVVEASRATTQNEVTATRSERIVLVLLALICIVSFVVLIEISISHMKLGKIEDLLCKPDQWLTSACSPSGQGWDVFKTSCDNLERMARVCEDVSNVISDCFPHPPPA